MQQPMHATSQLLTTVLIVCDSFPLCVKEERLITGFLCLPFPLCFFSSCVFVCVCVCVCVCVSVAYLSLPAETDFPLVSSFIEWGGVQDFHHWMISVVFLNNEETQVYLSLFTEQVLQLSQFWIAAHINFIQNICRLVFCIFMSFIYQFVCKGHWRKCKHRFIVWCKLSVMLQFIECQDNFVLEQMRDLWPALPSYHFLKFHSVVVWLRQILLTTQKQLK